MLIIGSACHQYLLTHCFCSCSAAAAVWPPIVYPCVQVHCLTAATASLDSVVMVYFVGMAIFVLT